jgi:predicted phage terminase large subunit-like protein
MFKKEWFQYYPYRFYQPTKQHKFDQIIGSWDLTFGDSSEDFCVGTVWGKSSREQKYYLLDMYRGKWNIIEQINQIQAMKRAYPTALVLVEDRASGRPLIDLLKSKVNGLHPVNPQGGNFGGNKEVRAMAVAPLFEAGMVMFPSREVAPWMSDVENELTLFPRSSNDDIVDSISQALNYFNQSGFNVLAFDGVLQSEKELKQKMNPYAFAEWKYQQQKTKGRDSMGCIFEGPSAAKELRDIF